MTLMPQIQSQGGFWLEDENSPRAQEVTGRNGVRTKTLGDWWNDGRSSPPTSVTGSRTVALSELQGSEAATEEAGTLSRALSEAEQSASSSRGSSPPKRSFCDPAPGLVGQRGGDAEPADRSVHLLEVFWGDFARNVFGAFCCSDKVQERPLLEDGAPVPEAGTGPSDDEDESKLSPEARALLQQVRAAQVQPQQTCEEAAAAAGIAEASLQSPGATVRQADAAA